MAALRRVLNDGRSTMVSLMIALPRLLYNGQSNRFCQSPSPFHHSLSIPSLTSESKLINGKYLHRHHIFQTQHLLQFYGSSGTIALQRSLYNGCSTTFDPRRSLYDGCSKTVALELTIALGRLLWDGCSGTVALGRLLWDGCFGTVALRWLHSFAYF